MSAVTFFVAGIPIPQGSKKGFSQRGSTFVQLVDDNKVKLRPWRAEVTRVAKASWADRERLDGAVLVELVFVFERPKSVKREHPSVRPDVDKLARAVLDGITDAGVWRDDAQVVRLVSEKSYGAAPGVHVVISKVSDAARVAAPLEGEQMLAEMGN